MSKQLIVLLIVFCLSSAFKKDGCIQGIKATYSQFLELTKEKDTNQIIDGYTKIVLTLPDLLDNCQQKQGAEYFRQQASQQCIYDLNKAAKLYSKIVKETDNQIKTARDSALLDILYQNKLKKQCKFLQNVTVNDIKSGGICLESVYQLSLKFQNLLEALKAEDEKKMMLIISDIIQSLPDMLDACGQSQAAEQIKKWFPPMCIAALQNFSGQAIQMLHNYDHVQWLIKHYKQFLTTLKQVKKTCPLFS